MMRAPQTFRAQKELWLALLAAIVVTAGYVFFTQASGMLPPAAHLLGHGIGILGFVLMLMTETLYTLRKRAKSARWGPVSSWLRFHIFTGLVGPYLVLLHPAMRFHGLAAVLSLLTGVVVLSGVTGRYIYTRGPRVAEEIVGAGAAVDVGFAEPAATAASAAALPAASQPAVRAAAVPAAAVPVSGARRGLAVWRAIHVPLTFALFAIAVAHIVGAVYYATLLR